MQHRRDMRAIVFDTFGGPDVLTLQHISMPEPAPGQVRVAIHAAGTNPIDTGNRQDGSWAGVTLPAIPGYEASGIIDAVGPGVTHFVPGDEVFYMTDILNNACGTYAEYHVIDAALIARKPPTLTHIEAAALPLAAGTAYEIAMRRLTIARGEWVLLYGAAGGVGSLVLQMAVARGAHVIAVARAHHHALLTELGAADCLDYTTLDVQTEAQVIAGRKLDVIVDLVGGETLARGLTAIRPYGRAASIASLSGELNPLLDSNVTLHGILVHPDQSRLEAIATLVTTGVLRPIIDQVLPLEEAAQAHRRLETGHGQGKVILAIREKQS